MSVWIHVKDITCIDYRSIVHIYVHTCCYVGIVRVTCATDATVRRSAKEKERKEVNSPVLFVVIQSSRVRLWVRDEKRRGEARRDETRRDEARRLITLVFRLPAISESHPGRPVHLSHLSDPFETVSSRLCVSEYGRTGGEPYLEEIWKIGGQLTTGRDKFYQVAPPRCTAS